MISSKGPFINLSGYFLFYLFVSFLGLTLSSLTAFPQVSKPVFDHITTDNGLSNNTVFCILRDKYGLVWFGTEDGLNKYNGYRVKVYKNRPGDPKSISQNLINAIYEDKGGNIWVGGAALSLYDRKSDSFIN